MSVTCIATEHAMVYHHFVFLLLRVQEKLHLLTEQLSSGMNCLVCNRNLRSSENGSLILPKTRTALYTGSFAFSAPKIWNTFPT